MKALWFGLLGVVARGVSDLPTHCAAPHPRVEARDGPSGLVRALRRAPLGGTKCLKRVLPCVSQRGQWLEFGVYSGTTLRQIARARRGAPVFGFDSFAGLPETWRASNESAVAPFVGKGAFDLGGRPPFPESRRIKWRVGPFADSIPRFLDEFRDQPLAFVHIDCDLYSSTATVLTLLADRLVPGVVIVFDELVNYPEWREGECRALFEFLLSRGLAFDVVATSSRDVPEHPKNDGPFQALAIRLVRGDGRPPPGDG